MVRAFSKIWDRLFGRQAAETPVRAESERRWDGARTTRLNSAHWSRASGIPINAELSSWLLELRNRCEYEVANNPIVEGIVNTYAMDVVGPDGPVLHVTSENEEYNNQREKLFGKWFRSAGANRQLSGADILHQWVRSLWTSGEFVTQMVSVNDRESDLPVKMRLLPIHTHRLLTPPEFLGDPAVALGVRRDENRNPTAYYISEPYIFGAFEVYTGKYYEIPYRDLIHGYLLTEEDQVRGVPWLASCLDTIADLRDYDQQVLDAARAAADFGVLLQTTSPDVPAAQVQGSTAFERRQLRFLPPGYVAQQIRPEQPTANHDEYYNSQLRKIGRPVNMPLMMILLDSSNHNYSSARFDAQLYWRGVARIQGWMGRIMDRIEAAVVREAELAGELPAAPEDLETAWIWIKPPHVDPEKEAKAEAALMENGTLPYSIAAAMHGFDRDRLIALRKQDNEKLKEAGLPEVGAMQQQLGGFNGAGDKPGNGDDQDGEDKPPMKSKTSGNRFAKVSNG